jgi:hypothetical protein
MKYYFTLYILFGVAVLRAQFNSEFLKYSDYRAHISLYGEAEWNSTALHNKFFQSIYAGNEIDIQSKDKVSDKLLQKNVAGAIANFGVNAFFGKEKSRFDWLVGIKHQEFLNCSFSKDLFRTAFYGNSEFKGKYADFNNTAFNYFKFQEFKIGFMWKNVDTSGKLGGALSFISGQRVLQYKTLDTNYLYTAPDATELIYQANFSLSMSDTTPRALFGMAGLGLSGDLYAETPYRSKWGNSRFIISVNNLGFIRWNKNSRRYSVDSVFNFQGVQLNNILDLNDSVLNSINADTLINRTTELSKDYFNVNLPMNFLLIHEVSFNTKYSLRVGFRNIFNANFRPFFFVENRFNLHPNCKLGGTFSYGGYGKFSGGIYAEYKIQKLNFRLGSNAIQGIVMSDKTFGGSMYLTLVKIW